MANTPWLAGSRIRCRSCCRVSQGRDSVRRSSGLSIFGLRVRHAAIPILRRGLPVLVARRRGTGVADVSSLAASGSRSRARRRAPSRSGSTRTTRTSAAAWARRRAQSTPYRSSAPRPPASSRFSICQPSVLPAQSAGKRAEQPQMQTARGEAPGVSSGDPLRQRARHAWRRHVDCTRRAVQLENDVAARARGSYRRLAILMRLAVGLASSQHRSLVSRPEDCIMAYAPATRSK
jgi:hypothetical protein